MSRQANRTVKLARNYSCPKGRGAEDDTYFRISRSDDAHAWTVSALTSIIAELSRSTLNNDSLLRRLDE